MKATIAVLPGDGIGPEVVAQGTRLLAAVGEKFGHAFTLAEAKIGGAAIDATGEPLPQVTLQLCRKADAVLLGAVGGPKWDKARARPEQGLLSLRKELGLFANLRPVVPDAALLSASPLKPELLKGVDLLVVRELTGGIYFGNKRRDEQRAVDECSYSKDEVARVVRVAGQLARGRKKKLTSVDKANVLETSRLWREVASAVVRAEFPDVQLEHVLVDSFAMLMLKSPRSYDVVVTENMFGDILTDEASMLSGSIGLLPSASLGEGKRGLFEPIHGSAPDIAGKGIANPYGTLRSVAMLLRHSLGLVTEADAVERAVGACIERGLLTGDLSAPGKAALSTDAVGQAVTAELLGGHRG
ncbi:MAG: 3-isopropylmalate dehydrogenase [Myxococcaceae bacterium]